MLPESIDRRSEKQIAGWLLLCCALVLAMVVLGGVTRLTGSGLSMVDWQPLMGVIPPTSEAQWQTTFEKYQQYPEYQKKNFHMDLSQFKVIFGFEYAHRLLGRTIGVVFLLPFLFFLLRRRVSRPLAPKLATLFVLGGLQGLLGWFMVKSGLIDVPHVSQYRLTAHLMTAVLIYGAMLWVAFGLIDARARFSPVSAGFRRLLTAAFVLVCITIASGGFVAGLKAGFAYNTFPLMAGKLVPDGLLASNPWWTSFFEDITTVQFDHRVLALTTFSMVVAVWVTGMRTTLAPTLRLRLHLMLAAAMLQVTLG
ncbi:MAG: COX15/CtaA family protein, partial [Ectothiorhodospiraceae bacterium]